MNTEKIKNIREELEITQEDISKVLGCTRTAYSLWEINKNTIPLYYLNKISNEYNINIDYLVDLSNDKYIKFDKVEIDRINLGKKLKEARKSINYTQEKGKVVITLKCEDKDLIFSVSDNGSGIPQEDIPNMFQRFSQGTSKKRSTGTGLGLYLSRQIIESHGGKIWLESMQNKGSEFFFLLLDAAKVKNKV